MARCCLYTAHIHGQVLFSHSPYPSQVLSSHSPYPGQVLSSHSPYPWPGIVFTQPISMARCCFMQPISMARCCFHTAHIHGQLLSPHSPYPWPGVARLSSYSPYPGVVFTQPISMAGCQAVFIQPISRCCLHIAHIQVLSSHSPYPGVVFTQHISMACCQAVCTLFGLSMCRYCWGYPCPGVVRDVCTVALLHLSMSRCPVRPVHVRVLCHACQYPCVLSGKSISSDFSYPGVLSGMSTPWCSFQLLCSFGHVYIQVFFQAFFRTCLHLVVRSGMSIPWCSFKHVCTLVFCQQHLDPDGLSATSIPWWSFSNI